MKTIFFQRFNAAYGNKHDPSWNIGIKTSRAVGQDPQSLEGSGTFRARLCRAPVGQRRAASGGLTLSRAMLLPLVSLAL
jgi:hypothetical protein